MSIELNAEQVNKFLADAILKSTIGKEVEASVNRVVSQCCGSYNNPFDATIKAMVSSLIHDELLKNHREKLAAKIQEALASKLTDEFIIKIVDAGIADRKNW